MKEKEDLLLLSSQLCFPLYAASNLITRLYRPLLSKIGLTYPQYLVMLVLWEEQPQSVSDLGRALHLDSGTLTPLLKRLEASGLVLRQRAVSDERRVMIVLTQQGRDLRERAALVPRALHDATRCTQDDVVELRKRVNALIEQITPPASSRGGSHDTQRTD